MAQRLHLPFEVLSDARLAFVEALRLPTFEVDGMRLVKRLTLVIKDTRIEHVFYPVFPAGPGCRSGGELARAAPDVSTQTGCSRVAVAAARSLARRSACISARSERAKRRSAVHVATSVARS
jgi:Redoxin